MTIEDFRKLKNGDYVKLLDNIYKTTFVPSNGIHASYWDCENKFAAFRLYDSKCLQGNLFIVIDSSNLQNQNLSFGLPDISIPTEKEVLEYQLKEEQTILNMATDNILYIKAKIEELTKPKLKIGGLYKFEKFGNDFIGVVVNADRNSGWYGVLNHRLNGIITYNIEHYKVTEITNPNYSHIGKTIMEFHNLKFGNT